MSSCKSKSVDFTIVPPCHNNNGCKVGVKTDGDLDLDPTQDVVVVLAPEHDHHHDDDDDDDGATIFLPCNPTEGERHTVIAAGQDAILDGGNFEVSQERIKKGDANDIIFADLSLDDCGGPCGACGCKRRAQCDCPKGKWFVLGGSKHNAD